MFLKKAIFIIGYLLKLVSGRNTSDLVFMCQNHSAILDFGNYTFHNGTVNWFIIEGGKLRLLAYQIGSDEHIIAPQIIKIDSDKNLVLNISQESSGKYIRRIINGGIFKSSVNLHVIDAPSGVPIVNIKKDKDKEFFEFELPQSLGRPEANLELKPLQLNTTTVNGTDMRFQQYEVCLSGISIKCFKETPCKSYTIQLPYERRNLEDNARIDIKLCLGVSSIIHVSLSVLFYVISGIVLQSKSGNMLDRVWKFCKNPFLYFREKIKSCKKIIIWLIFLAIYLIISFPVCMYPKDLQLPFNACISIIGNMGLTLVVILKHRTKENIQSGLPKQQAGESLMGNSANRGSDDLQERNGINSTSKNEYIDYQKKQGVQDESKC